MPPSSARSFTLSRTDLVDPASEEPPDRLVLGPKARAGRGLAAFPGQPLLVRGVVVWPGEASTRPRVPPRSVLTFVRSRSRGCTRRSRRGSRVPSSSTARSSSRSASPAPILTFAALGPGSRLGRTGALSSPGLSFAHTSFLIAHRRSARQGARARDPGAARRATFRVPRGHFRADNRRLRRQYDLALLNGSRRGASSARRLVAGAVHPAAHASLFTVSSRASRYRPSGHASRVTLTLSESRWPGVRPRRHRPGLRARTSADRVPFFER